ncbi:MAG: hypothetical protein ABII01_05020 [Candidatus Woesearchaeota archaeon]
MKAVGIDPREQDRGFFANQYFLNAPDLTPAQIDSISAFLANPDLFERAYASHHQYAGGRLLGVTSYHPDMKEAQRIAYAGANIIDVQGGKHMRHDIMKKAFER